MYPGMVLGLSDHTPGHATVLGAVTLGARMVEKHFTDDVWDHFYEDSACSPEVSTHYVNLPHVLQLKQPLELDALPNDQHSGWRWQDMKEAVIAEDVHPYVRVYAQWLFDHGSYRGA